MGVVRRWKRSRSLQLITAVIGIFTFYWFFFSGRKSHGAVSDTQLSNEEVNSILDGENVVGQIQRRALGDFGLKSPYSEGDVSPKNWYIQGDALVKNDDYIRLTTEEKHQAGSIFNKNPIVDRSFEVNFNFSINGKAKASGVKGDGFALFLTDEILPQGGVFGSQDKFKGLGVFFDTYRNAQRGPSFPYITTMLGDGVTLYDKDNDGKSNELSGCTARGIYNPKRGFVKARLLYTSQDGYLSLDYNVHGDWKNCFTLQDIHLPETLYLGYSAATGDLVENLDIFSSDVYVLERDGEAIKTFDDLLDSNGSILLADQKDDDDQKGSEVEYDDSRRGRKRRGYSKERSDQRKAKLRARLRNAKNRVVSNESKNEGPGFFSTLWSLIKGFFLLLFLLLVSYIAFTFYRVRKRRIRAQHRKTGILM